MRFIITKKLGLKIAFNRSRNQANMNSIESSNAGRKLYPRFCSRRENLVSASTAVIHRIHRCKRFACLIALPFFIPFSAFADGNYNVTNVVIGAVLPRLAQTGNDRPDTLLQLMTAFSLFAVVGMIIQRFSRLFQKRRSRRPFHIWGLW